MTNINKKNTNESLPKGYISEAFVAKMLNRKIASLRSSHSRGMLAPPRTKTGKQVIYHEGKFYRWLSALEEKTSANDNKRKVSNKNDPYKPSYNYTEKKEIKKEEEPFFISKHISPTNTNTDINTNTNDGGVHA